MEGAVDLRVIAECAGTRLDDVQALNPRAAPAGHAREPHASRVKVPHGHAVGTHRCLADLPAEKRVAFRTHVVARGQTLSVARQALRHARPSEIADANGLRRRQARWPGARS